MKSNTFLREVLVKQIVDMLNKKKNVLNVDKIYLDNKIDDKSVVISSAVKLYGKFEETTIAWLSLKPKYLMQIKKDIENNKFHAYIPSIGDQNTPPTKMKTRLKPQYESFDESINIYLNDH